MKRTVLVRGAAMALLPAILLIGCRSAEPTTRYRPGRGSEVSQSASGTTLGAFRWQAREEGIVDNVEESPYGSLLSAEASRTPVVAWMQGLSPEGVESVASDLQGQRQVDGDACRLRSGADPTIFQCVIIDASGGGLAVNMPAGTDEASARTAAELVDAAQALGSARFRFTPAHPVSVDALTVADSEPVGRDVVRNVFVDDQRRTLRVLTVPGRPEGLLGILRRVHVLDDGSYTGPGAAPGDWIRLIPTSGGRTVVVRLDTGPSGTVDELESWLAADLLHMAAQVRPGN